MAFTANLGITQLTQGQAAAHVTVNEALAVLDVAIAGRLALALTTATRGLSGGESTRAMLHVTSTTMACALEVQAVPKVWVLINGGTHAVTLRVSGQASPPVIAAGKSAILVCDGTIVRRITADA